MILLLCGLLEIASAEYPSKQRLRAWRFMTESLNYPTAYTLIDTLATLPKESWPEPYRQVLLNLCDFYMMKAKDKHSWDIIGEAGLRNRQGFELYQFVLLQMDNRLLPFNINFGGYLRGGESLDAIVFDYLAETLHQDKSLERQKYLLNHSVMPELIFDPRGSIFKLSELPVETQIQQKRLRKALFKAAQSQWIEIRYAAVANLGYAPTEEAIEYLTQISEEDPYMVDGKYPLREWVTEILKVIHQGEVCPY